MVISLRLFGLYMKRKKGRGSGSRRKKGREDGEIIKWEVKEREIKKRERNLGFVFFFKIVVKEKMKMIVGKNRKDSIF